MTEAALRIVSDDEQPSNPTDQLQPVSELPVSLVLKKDDYVRTGVLFVERVEKVIADGRDGITYVLISYTSLGREERIISAKRLAKEGAEMIPGPKESEEVAEVTEPKV